MDSILRKGLFLVTLTGAIGVFPATAYASDIEDNHTMPGVGIEQVLNDCYSSQKEIQVEDYLTPEDKGEYLDMAFADVESFLYIRSEPTKQSEWVGKLYPGYAAKIVGPVGEWTKIESGSVTGYVYSQYVIIGRNAQQKAEEVVEASASADPKEAFSYAESREEEEARLAAEAEEAARKAEEEAQAVREAAGSGQAVVDYACQFIGNPYVWGGTSLTNGADCSGFIMSVYAHFGYDLPHSSSALRGVGRGVSYAEAQPGDIICYSGHVAIYIGGGAIVHASNERDGIKISSNAAYTTILAVRRVV